MRIALGTCLGLAVLAGLAAAQQPPAGGNPITLNPNGQKSPAPAAPAAPVAPADPRLDQHLLQWAAKMRTVVALEADLTRTEKDPEVKTEEVFQGKAKFLRTEQGGLFASLYLQKTTNS